LDLDELKEVLVSTVLWVGKRKRGLDVTHEEGLPLGVGKHLLLLMLILLISHFAVGFD
jgi:hypothetical protein